MSIARSACLFRLLSASLFLALALLLAPSARGAGVVGDGPDRACDPEARMMRLRGRGLRTEASMANPHAGRALSLARPLSLAALAAALSCGEPPRAPEAPAGEAGRPGAAPTTRFTDEANAALVASLPLADPEDFEDARRGLVASEPGLVVEGLAGRPAWDMAAYAFVEGDAPPTVNPSLWRQAKLNGIHGLFQVTEGVYQVRGYDISNTTWIRGETGWIVVDPLTTEQTARAAAALARAHLGDAPVMAVIFTHSHADHFAGVGGVLSAEEAAARRVPIVAPAGFLEEATSENVLAGLAMGRRATFMYGTHLPVDARGHVDTGLGKGIPVGSGGILAPTVHVDRTPQELTLDGVRFVFQHAPESEAPAELTFYLPDAKAWCGAEIVSHVMHNLYTLRGAKVRDALRWSGYIDEALRLFGDMEVVFASHAWPTWGNARATAYLEAQRDTYKYIHDQTLRLANQGLTPAEIAEELELPEALRTRFASRGYYGTVRHNAKAVYQGYFGWYDGNPANLDPLPPAEAGRRYVAFMGGASELKRKAAASFEEGDYRFVATVLNHLVFADPDDAEARELLARTYEQLAYRAEAGPWRDVYLSAALELREGPRGSPLVRGSLGILRQLPLERFFDAMATRLDGRKADGKQTTVNFVFTDAGETHVVEVANAVLHHRRGDADPAADATLHLTRDFLLRLSAQEAGLRELLFSDDVRVEGSRLALLGFFSLLDRPTGEFAIVTP